VERRHGHGDTQVPGVAPAQSDGPLGRINLAETRARLRNRGRCGTYAAAGRRIPSDFLRCRSFRHNGHCSPVIASCLP
jgi:hypothetical protein